MNGLSSPLRFQMAMATVAVSGALAMTEVQTARPDPRPLFTLQDESIDESSGLLDVEGLVLTVNDSGDDAIVYVVNAADGRTIGRTTFADEVEDVEAMARGLGDTIWVGDIGDNPGNRSSVSVYEMPLPTSGDVSVEAQRYDLVYEGGPRDAETLLVHPETGRLYVVSKGMFGGQVFQAPRELRADRANVLRPVADVPGLVTDGAFFPDGRFVALRTYSNLLILRTKDWNSAEGMPLPDQRQGEGLAMRNSGEEVLISTEGSNSDVLRVPLTRAILDVTAPLSESPSASPADTTADDGRTPAGDDDRTLWLAVAVGAVALAAGALLVPRWLRRRRG